MEPPPEMKRGPKVVRDAVNDLRRWVISQRPLPSLDCDVHDTPQGRVILPKASGGSPAISTRILRPFELVPTLDENEDLKLRVVASTLGGRLPEDFHPTDDPPFLLGVSGTGVVYGKLSIDSATGEIVSAEIASGTTVPINTASAFHIQIGGFVVEDESIRATNFRFGPIDAHVCRNWYRTDPPFYSVYFSSP